MASERRREGDDRFSFEIVEKLATLSTSPKGWSKEFNYVAWNEGKPEYDLREWDSKHESMSKGVTLSAYELSVLLEAAAKRDLESEIRGSSKRGSSDAECDEEFGEAIA